MPLAISVALGVYVVVKAFGSAKQLKQPLLDDHVPPVAPVNEAAVSVRLIVALFSQTGLYAFNVTVGLFMKVNSTVELFTALQLPLFRVLMVKVTEPASKSAADGVYVVVAGAIALVSLKQVGQLELDVQCNAPVEEVPVNVITGLFLQTEPGAVVIETVGAAV